MERIGVKVQIVKIIAVTGGLKQVPGESGYELAKEENIKADEMVQNAIFYSIRKIERKIRGKPRMALIKEGPYAVTVKSDRRTIQCQL